MAFDRLLARLVVVAANRWLLKGGFALDLRLTERARATKDIDLDWRDGEDVLLDTLLDAAAHDAGDFFAFHIERASPLEDQLGASHRFRVSASLAGREFETFLLDIGFLAIPTEKIERVRGTHPVPEVLPPPPTDWSTPFGELATTVGIRTDLVAGHTAAAELLDPILNSRLSNGTWSIEKRQWTRPE